MSKPKNILVAPLNWGLGHATRCIPIIKALQSNGFTPIIASDGDALALLKKEFPKLQHVTLPSYNIKYTKKGIFLKLKLALKITKLISTSKKENSLIKKLVVQEDLYGIISDNRFGVYHKSIPSIYITHQINVLSGITTALTSKIHQHTIKKFDECWVPDYKNKKNYSGKLSEVSDPNLNVKHIGLLSRFKKIEATILYDYLIILSGPEPQRSLLENKLLSELKHSDKKIVLIRGLVELEEKITIVNKVICYNYMTSDKLELAINQSKIIIARSGYTTIMDLAKMNKKAFFIPTPGQNEQLYLAERLHKKGYAPFCKQEEFCKEKLKRNDQFRPLSVTHEDQINFNTLFNCFQSKRKL